MVDFFSAVHPNGGVQDANAPIAFLSANAFVV